MEGRIITIKAGWRGYGESRERKRDGETPPVATPSPNHSLNVHKQVSSLAVKGIVYMTNVIPESTKFPLPLSHLLPPPSVLPHLSWRATLTRNQKSKAREATSEKSQTYIQEAGCVLAERYGIDRKKERWERKKERERKRKRETRYRRSSLNLKCKYTQQITIGDRHPYF